MSRAGSTKSNRRAKSHESAVLEGEKKPDPGGAAQIAKLLRETRLARNLAQTELAARAAISPRTVFRAEKGEKTSEALIVSLALALKQDPAQWLAVAGYTVSPSEVVKYKDQFTTRHKAEAEERSGIVFDEMLSQIDDGLSLSAPKMMCVCYSSRPTAIVRDEIIRQVSALIAKGLHVAMFCPYPEVDRRSALEDWCARHYSEVRNDVVSLALQYRRSIGREHSQRVQLLVPTRNDLLCIPPATSFALRPTFVTVPLALESAASTSRLGVLVDMPYEDGPRWFDMHYAEHTKGRDAADLLRVWRDYFRPALSSWRGTDDWDLNDLGKSWELFNLETI